MTFAEIKAAVAGYRKRSCKFLFLNNLQGKLPTKTKNYALSLAKPVFRVIVMVSPEDAPLEERRATAQQPKETNMPRLILRPEQVDEWPTVRECVLVRTGTTKGYTRVAERRTWHPYAGKYGIGYVCSLGPHNGSTRYQDIIYCIDPRSTGSDGLAASRRCRHWSRHQTC